jgi:hypothetical protein
MKQPINVTRMPRPEDSLCVASNCYLRADDRGITTVGLCLNHINMVVDQYDTWSRKGDGNPPRQQAPSPVAILKRDDHRCPTCHAYLCRQRAMDLFFCRTPKCEQPDLSRVEMVQLVAKRKRAKQDLAEQTARLANDSTAAEAGSIVYYLAFGDRVKFGTTTNLPKRLLAIPHDEVLAIEPGGYGKEAERHSQFRSSRINGEWFRRTKTLERHMAQLNERYRAPQRGVSEVVA